MPPLPSPGVDQLCDEYLRLEAFYAAHGDRPATVRVLEWELECPTPASALAFLDYIACRRMNDFKTSEAVPVILDCGANIGYTALWYKRLYPAAQVVAFEPDPVFAPMLRRNLARNGAGDVTVVAAAAWTADGDAAWLTQDVDGSRLADAGATGATTVATVDLARILRDFARIDLLKIDIEGAEYALLPHLAEALAPVRRVLVECHLQQQADYARLADVCSTLSRAGFTIAMNTYGPWRDLIRRHQPEPLHAEQYLLVSGWRAGGDEDDAIEREATTAPYAGLSSHLARVRQQRTEQAAWQDAVAALVAQAAGGRQLHVVRLTPPFTPEVGLCWKTPELPLPNGDIDGDRRSMTFLLEDGRLLGPAHASHDAIRARGLGQYCHWHDTLYWSTSDNSDPNRNGRTYTLVHLERPV